MHLLHRLREYWNSRAETYDTLFEKAPIRSVINEQLVSLVRGEPATVIDLGAGTGKLTAAIGTRFPNAAIHLLDISPRMLEYAQRRFLGDDRYFFHEGSFTEMPIESGSIDLVVSSFALHHVPDSEKIVTMNEIKRILAPSGQIVLADEIICEDDLKHDPQRLHERMLEIFYPHENKEFDTATFSEMEEWPTSLDAMMSYLTSAGFVPNVIPLNALVAILFTG